MAIPEETFFLPPDAEGTLQNQIQQLVADRETREPADESKVMAVVKDCMAQGVIIGATNRSLPGFNNTLLLSPALICTAEDIDLITASIDQALTRVFG